MEICKSLDLWQGATREPIRTWICDRGATQPEVHCGTTQWAARLFDSNFVVRSSQTHEGYVRRSRLVRMKNPLPQMSTQFVNATLERFLFIYRPTTPGIAFADFGEALMKSSPR